MVVVAKPVGSSIWDEASSPAVACSKVVSMLVYKGSLSDERGTFVSLVMIQTLNPYLGRALCRGVDVPAHALGWVHQLLLFSPHKNDEPTPWYLRKRQALDLRKYQN